MSCVLAPICSRGGYMTALTLPTDMANLHPGLGRVDIIQLSRFKSDGIRGDSAREIGFGYRVEHGSHTPFRGCRLVGNVLDALADDRGLSFPQKRQACRQRRISTPLPTPAAGCQGDSLCNLAVASPRLLKPDGQPCLPGARDTGIRPCSPTYLPVLFRVDLLKRGNS
jgi:hypothetical protein